MRIYTIMINIYKTGTFYSNLQNESALVNRLRENFRAGHLKISIRVKNDVIDFTAKRKRLSVTAANSKILVDEYEFDDVEDAAEYVFGTLKGK